MLRLDSAGRECPEITMEGVLIVVESYYMTGRKWIGLLEFEPLPAVKVPSGQSPGV